MKQIISHLTDNDAYTFSCQYYVLQKYPRAEVEYTFFDRNDTVYPIHRFGGRTIGLHAASNDYIGGD